MSTRPFPLLGLVAGTLVALAACTACTTSLAPQNTSCADDNACADGLVCALGLCLDPTDQRLSTVDVEIDPTVADLPVQNLLGVDLSTSPRVDVSLAAGVLLHGSVLHGDTGLDAQLLARPEKSISGRVLAPTASTQGDGSFSLQVVDGQRYALTVSPTDPALPPLYLFDGPGETLRARGNADGNQTLEPILVADGTVVVSGVIKAGDGAAALGVPELAVALTVDGRRISSQGRTAADGTFQLALPVGATEVTLEISPTADNTAYPSMTVPGLDASASVDLGTVSLGIVSTPARFLAHIVDADGNTVPGATASLTAPIGNGVYRATVHADDAGNIDAQVPPGTYDLVVLGPPDAPSAGLLLSTDVDIPTTLPDFTLLLPARVHATGIVRDPDGKALAGAGLVLVRIGDVTGEPEAPLADTLVQFSAVSGDDGAFDIAVDPGRYRVSTRPALGQNAPAFSELVTVPAAGLDRDIRLPARAVVAGNVIFDGIPVANAYVRVFSTLLDEGGAAILLGEGSADPTGAFAIVVPDLVGDVQNPNPP